MEIWPQKKMLYHLLLYCLGGMAAGFINGLSGAGAGVVFLLFFSFLEGGLNQAVFSLTMACVIPLSGFSLLSYPPLTKEHVSLLPWICAVTILGGVCGARLQKKIRVQILKWIFAGLVIWAGWNMAVS